MAMYIFPLPSDLTPPTRIAPRFLSSECSFEGNNDIYGIGIRIGIYTQILAVWFANYFLLSEAQVLRDSVSIFSVAILIVSLIFAARPSDVYAVEGFVLLQILAWSCLMGVRAKSSYSRGIFSAGSLLRRITCELVNLMMVGLHVWFWWTGLDHMKKTPCATWFMMFVVKTDMFGWARKIMMALSLFVLLCTVYWVGVELLRPWTFWRMRVFKEEFEKAVSEWNEMQNEKTPDCMDEEEDSSDATKVSIQDKSSGDSDSRCSPTESNISLDPKENSMMRKSTDLVQVIDQNQTLPHTSNRPVLPHALPTSPVQTKIRKCRNEFKILHDVYEGEIYIQHCISASPYQMGTDGKPLAFPVIARSILFPKKYRTSNTSNGPPSWFRCQIHAWLAFLTFRFPPQAFVVYSHLRQSRLLDPLNGPFQTYAAITYTVSSSSNKKGLPSWPSVTLASSLLLTVPEVPKKVWLGWYYAILDLLIHVIVILQLELTLRWNNVRGLSGLWTSVGQLIPFIIGVGGLGMVLGRWSSRIWVKRQGRRGKDSVWEQDDATSSEPWNESFGLHGRAREGYAQWKKLHEMEMNSAASGQQTSSDT